MIYEWRCEVCKELTTKKSPMKYRNTPPDHVCHLDHLKWKRVITEPPSVPFQTLRDRGIFMDEQGNYPPRRLEGFTEGPAEIQKNDM